MAPEARPSDAQAERFAAASDVAGEALARYYDLDVSGELDDVELYLALAARLGGPVLELAVGTGRVAVPLAAAGHRVTGVDRDPFMLERARQRWANEARAQRRAAGRGGGRRSGQGRLELVEGDITQLDLGERFSLVVIALNSFLLLPGREAQAAALDVVARHLAADGRAVIDVWLPTPDDLALYDGRSIVEWVRVDRDTGETVAKLTAARHEPAIGHATVTTFFDAWPAGAGPLSRVSREDDLAFISATELAALAGKAGLAVETIGGDHAMAPFGPGSERAVAVCALL